MRPQKKATLAFLERRIGRRVSYAHLTLREDTGGETFFIHMAVHAQKQQPNHDLMEF